MHSSDTNILVVPGLGNSGPKHWQTLWEQRSLSIRRAELGGWSHPNKNSWVTNLGLAIRQSSKPIILVAHSLGCHAVAWWAAHEPDAASSGVAGAMLVAPPNVDHRPVDSRLTNFGPAPKVKLPFPTVLVGSENDHYCSFEHAQKLARRWGARFVNAGRFGHINADSGIGDWPYGLYLLADLLKPEYPGENREAIERIARYHRRRQGNASLFEEGTSPP
jgi:uncharacterized protein